MKVVYLISRAVSSDGPINQALNILVGLNKYEKIDATIVTLSPELEKRSWLNRFLENGIKVYQLNLASYNIYGCVRKLNKYIITNGIQIVHSSGFRADLINLLLNKDVKRISTQRSYPDEVAEDLNPIIRSFVNWFHLYIIKKLDCIVACSKSLQNVFATKYNMDVACVQNAVNTDYFRPLCPFEKNSKRKSLSLPLNKRIILVLGVLNQRKNNTVIIEAFKQNKNNDNLLVFVGGGPDEDSLKKQAADDMRIIFAGVTKTPLDYLQAADVLVSSSLAEGLPNTVLEALSVGLPVLLSDIDPHKELIAGTAAGVVFSRIKISDLTAKLNDVESWEMSRKSQAARNLALNVFSIKTLARNYSKVYLEVLKKVSSTGLRK